MQFRYPLSTLVFLIAHSIFGQTTEYRFTINPIEINSLKGAPKEALALENISTGRKIHLTNPEGEISTYYCFENNIVSEETKALHPYISTYTGFDLYHPDHTIMITLSYDILHAIIMGPDIKTYTVDVDSSDPNKYIAKVLTKKGEFHCGTNAIEHAIRHEHTHGGIRTPTNGATIRNYRFAMVITDEFEAQYGANATTTAINIMAGLTAKYKSTIAVTFTAIVRPETTVYNINPPGFADAFLGGQAVAAYFSVGEYDLGGVFHHESVPPGSYSGSGEAFLGVVCVGSGSPPNKARSWNQASDIDFMYYIAVHEIGHLFNANHSFNSNLSNTICAAQIDASSSVEPGAGSTIMSYAGNCTTNPQTLIGHNLVDGSGNVIDFNDDYFHGHSIEQMLSYIGTTSCASNSASGNTPPVANANPCNLSSITIPSNTPFQLTAQATDSNNDNLTYCWEQHNIGPPHGAPNVACGSTTGPLFRSYLPTSSPVRYFPALKYILNNNNVPPFANVGECLPSASRAMLFKVVVRDNNTNAMGIDMGSFTVNTSNTVGPLAVSSQSTNGISYANGSSQNVTWSGSNSSSLCNSMNILLSIDGGNSFPYILVSNTPNDGSQSVTIPANIPATSRARIKVESNCNACVKFFDINSNNFSITSSCLAPQTLISPTINLTAAAGSSSLNLGMTNNIGSVVTQFTGSISTADNFGNLVFLDNTPPVCTPAGNLTFYDVILFSVNVTGSYTINHGGPFGTVMNLYQYEFTGSNCSNHVTSNATQPTGSGGITLADGITVNLTASNLYYIMLSSFNTSFPTIPFNYTITFPAKPAGSSIYNGVILPPNYSYTYIAVNTSNNTVSQVSAASNFTSLPSGDYKIYGAAYFSGSGSNPPAVNPTTWIGQNFTTLQSAAACQNFSLNFRNVYVTSCSAQVSSQADSGVGTLRDVVACAAPGSTITFAAGVDTIFLTQALTINNDLTINGNNLLLIRSTFNGTNSITISAGKTISLQNLKIHQLGSPVANPVILNQGTLNLTNLEAKANVTQIIRNSGSGIVNTNGIVNLKLN